jgi:hypothetical protein
VRREALSHESHKELMIPRVEDTCMGLRRVVVVFMGEDRHNVRIRTVVMEIIRQSTSAGVVELVTEQQYSALAKADLEQRSHNGLYGHNVPADSRQGMSPRFGQVGIGRYMEDGFDTVAHRWFGCQ